MNLRFHQQCKILVNMPDSHIPTEVRELLSDTRYGLSFPAPSFCQMRFKRNRVDHGGSYPYSRFGGVRGAVLAAIDDNKALREQFLRKSDGKPAFRTERRKSGTTGVVGVAGAPYLDGRRQIWSWRYQVSWRKNNRPCSKTFHLALDSTPDQMLHAFRSAIQFRAEYEALLSEFDPSKYKHWRIRRLYEPRQPLLRENFWPATY